MSEPTPLSVPLSIVVAVQFAQDNLPELVEQLDPPGHPGVEFILCYTDADPKAPGLVAGYENLRTVRGQSGSLIPQLWRDGIMAAKGAAVAVTTAHCIPNADWVDRLMSCDISAYAGVGGAIEIDPLSDSKGWAVFLLRYTGYAPPLEGGAVDDIAADNAVYRRDAVLRHSDLLEQGFWEPSFHRRFQADGLQLYLDPALVVRLRNRYTTAQFAGQRFRHGKEFGLERALALPKSRRLFLLLISPLLPLLVLGKLARAAFNKGLGFPGYLRALPWLVLFVLAWTTGEAAGYLNSLRR